MSRMHFRLSVDKEILMVSIVDSRLTYSGTTYSIQQIMMDLQETVGVLSDPDSSVPRAECRETEAVMPAEQARQVLISMKQTVPCQLASLANAENQPLRDFSVLADRKYEREVQPLRTESRCIQYHRPVNCCRNNKSNKTLQNHGTHNGLSCQERVCRTRTRNHAAKRRCFRLTSTVPKMVRWFSILHGRSSFSPIRSRYVFQLRYYENRTYPDISPVKVRMQTSSSRLGAFSTIVAI